MAQKRNIKFLSKLEVRQIIDACPDDRYGRRARALLEVLFSTGLRISEALRLDIEVFHKEAFNKEVIETFELSVVGKGGWTRTIYFAPTALKAVWAYLIEREEEDSRLFLITVRQCQ